MERDGQFSKTVISCMSWAERIMSVLVGVALLVASAALIVRTLVTLPSLFTIRTDLLLPEATGVLNNVLLVLMLIELAYTVVLSLRGMVLVVEPFLIVGVIATVRRILVITIGERGSGSPQVSELYVLIGLLLAFVASIFILSLRTRTRANILPRSSPAAVSDDIA